jgi:hypothetical protein
MVEPAFRLQPVQGRCILYQWGLPSWLRIQSASQASKP